MKRLCLILIVFFAMLSFASCNYNFRNLRRQNDNADAAIGCSLIEYYNNKVSPLISMWHFFYRGERFEYSPDNHDDYLNNLYEKISIAISNGKKTERDTVVSDGYIVDFDSKIFYLFYDEKYNDTLIFDGESLYVCDCGDIINAINEDSTLKSFYENPALKIEDLDKCRFYYNRYFVSESKKSYFKEFDVVNDPEIKKTKKQIEEIALGIYPDVFEEIIFTQKDPVSRMWRVSLGRGEMVRDGDLTVYILPDGQIKALDYTFSTDLFKS